MTASSFLRIYQRWETRCVFITEYDPLWLIHLHISMQILVTRGRENSCNIKPDSPVPPVV